MKNLTVIAILLFLSTEAFAIHPYKDYVAFPKQAGIPFDSLNIPTSDHIRLTGWYLHPDHDTSNLLMIIVGGDAGNMSYDLPLAQFILMNFHIPILLFDYRGFGSSDAFQYDSTAIGHPEYLTDLDAAVQYAQKNYSGKKVVVYGRSLGASLALVEGSMRSDIRGIIAESPYIVQDSLKMRFEAFNPGKTINPIRSASLEPFQHTKDFKTQNLLILHGADEKYIVSSELSSYLGTISIPNKKFVDFPGCDHMEIPQKATQLFGDEIAQFLAGL